MIVVGDDEGEQSVVDTCTDAYLAHYYIEKTQQLVEEEKVVKTAFESSILNKK